MEDIIKLMRWYDNCKNGFIFNYLKPRYRPCVSEDGEKELYSDDGKHYYPIHEITLEPSGLHYRFGGKNCYEKETNVFGYMNYNKQMNTDRYWKLEEVTEEIGGRKTELNFSDPKEDKEFDRIGRVMA